MSNYRARRSCWKIVPKSVEIQCVVGVLEAEPVRDLPHDLDVEAGQRPGLLELERRVGDVGPDCQHAFLDEREFRFAFSGLLGPESSEPASVGSVLAARGRDQHQRQQRDEQQQKSVYRASLEFLPDCFMPSCVS